MINLSKALAFALVVLVGVSAAYTQTLTNSATLRYASGYASSITTCPNLNMYADITHTASFNVVATQGGASLDTFCAGNVTLTVSQTGYADAGTVIQPAIEPFSTSGPSGGHVPYNFNAGDYGTLNGMLSSCGGTYTDFFTDGPPCYFSPGNGANVGVSYYNGVFPDCGAHSGNGNVYLYCTGVMRLNGVDYPIGPSRTITVPVTTSTTIPASMRYNCIVLHEGITSGGGTYYHGTSYSNPAPATVAVSIPINVGSCCTLTSGIDAVSVTPSPLSFTSNTAPGTITVQNTGTGTLTVTSVVPQAGFTFTPSGALPANMAAGAIASIPGTFTYTGAGAMPATITITTSGTSTCCTGMCAVSDTITVAATTTACAITTGILVVGVIPSPVLFTNNTAPGTITVQNTGTGTLNVTSIAPQAGFTFTPSGALPLNMASGTSAAIPGTFTYTGAGAMPATISITVSGTGTCCTGSCGVSNAITVSVATIITGGADLVASIVVHEAASNADVTATNAGALGTVNASTLKVELLHCTATNDADCTIGNYNYPTPVLGSGGSSVVRVDYDCAGYAYVKIRATADSSNTVSETNEGNNLAWTNFIPCATQTCSISGPNSASAPGAYAYAAACRDFDGSVADCGYMLDSDFSWSISPVSGTFATYTLDEDLSADKRVNSTLNVLGISTNGTITIGASSTSTLDNSPIDCDINVDALADTCAKQI